MSKLVIGKKAPNFDYKTNDGKSISISNLKGQKILLYFYE